MLLSSTAWSQNPMKLKTGKEHAPVKTEENFTLPEHLGAENIDRFMAGEVQQEDAKPDSNVARQTAAAAALALIQAEEEEMAKKKSE